MYIASDMGQIFHSTNDGQLWDTVDFRETHGGHSSQVQFTSNPQILYSVDYASGGDVVTPTKSIDGGVNWTPLAADPTGGGTYSVFADYNNPNRLLVSDYSHLWISTDGGATFNQRFATSDANGLLVGRGVFRWQQHLRRHESRTAHFHQWRRHEFQRGSQFRHSQHAKNSIVRRRQGKWHGALMGRYRNCGRCVRRHARIRQRLRRHLSDR